MVASFISEDWFVNETNCADNIPGSRAKRKAAVAFFMMVVFFISEDE
jgi:hypothetical protein